MRVKLIGSAIYSFAANSTLYLDGESFGSTGARAGDGVQNTLLDMPSGGGARASDFESWFYLAPVETVVTTVIQGLVAGVETPLQTIWLLQFAGTPAPSGFTNVQGQTITNIQAVITLAYPPVADTVVNLSFSGTIGSTPVSIAPSVTVPAGQVSVTTPLAVPMVPDGHTQTVILHPSVVTALGPIPSVATAQLTVNDFTP
jgi:hypothetical protein